MDHKPTIHLLCGSVAAGKTTLAKELARTLPAVRLSRDEWMTRLYGLPHDSPDYVERLGPCTELLWEVALDVLAAGSSVILDWNFWSRDRRREALDHATAAGHPLEAHWLDPPLDVVLERARRRFSAQPALAHRIDEEGVRHFQTIFEPPSEDEGLRITRHS